MSELLDAPNQQVVRADGSGPWEEGAGGSGEAVAGPKAEEPTAAETDYESMTKDQLIELAQSRGISPANAAMSKAELIAALDAG